MARFGVDDRVRVVYGAGDYYEGATGTLVAGAFMSSGDEMCKVRLDITGETLWFNATELGHVNEVQQSTSSVLSYSEMLDELVETRGNLQKTATERNVLGAELKDTSALLRKTVLELNELKATLRTLIS